MSEDLKLFRQFFQNTAEGSEITEIKMKVFGIYLTHSDKNGLCIKVNQFNHCCKPNTTLHLSEPYGLHLIACKNIKAGQEIVFAKYDPLHVEQKRETKRASHKVPFIYYISTFILQNFI